MVQRIQGAESRLLTAAEAANLLRASKAKLYRLVKSGEIAGYKVGSTLVFYENELHNYVRGQSNGTRQIPNGTVVEGGNE